ncbi:hypothetical protein [Actinomycetospora termitidis]|uniref:Oligosaccharide repeat unit polymerase n=1 Tax=Actinomycetospora termitidis TaxID=3053470 RepID=A0ABT7MG51_9PSEU|nr:hypothetical protein [Actinomycetospora sp. Odt1-22]MDL5159134.1 hypothetical protein [Actinomycetospora sp. Odt1-22]
MRRLDAPSFAPVPLTGVQFLVPLLCFVGLLAIPTALFFVPVLGAQPTLGVPALLFAVAVVYSAVRLLGLMWQARPQWLTIGFWIFTYCWIAVAGLTQALADSNPLGVTLTRDEQLLQALVLLVGMVCFDVGSRVRPTSGPGTGLPRRFFAPRRVLLLGWGSVAASPLFVLILGGPSALLSSREAVTDSLSDQGLLASATGDAVGGSLATVANVLPYIALLTLGKLLVDDRVLRRAVSNQVLFALLLGMNLLINNPISNSRFWAFTVILGVLYLWRRTARPLMLAAFVTGFAMASLVVFPYLDAWRVSESTARQYNVHYNDFSNPVDYVLAKTDYGSVTDVGIALRVTDAQGFSFGEQLLGDVLFWFPRAIWTDKPENTTVLIAHQIGFKFTNLDSPLWAEGWIDFGWVGVIAFLGAAGVVARRLDDSLIRARLLALSGSLSGRTPLAAVLVPAIAGYEFILLRGSLLQAMSRIVVMVGLLWLLSRRAPLPDPLPDDEPSPAPALTGDPR